MISIRSTALLSLGFIHFASSQAAEPQAAALRGKKAYDQKIKPLLEQYCYDCHSDGIEKGHFTFDKYDNYGALIADKKFWDHVRQQLVTHVMPPEKKPKPELQQRDEMVAWIDEAVFWYDPAKPDPGHVTSRRLNRTEYNNTVRDLLFVDTKPANAFPPDDTGYGYDNIGDVLSLSPMLMEKYLRTAHSLTEQVMNVSITPRIDVAVDAKKFYISKPPKEQGDKPNFKEVGKDDNAVLWFYSDMEATAKVQVPATGTYRLNIFAAATEAGDEPAKISLRINGKDVNTFAVETVYKRPKKPWQALQQTVQLNAGESKLSIRFLNGFSDPANPDPKKRERNVVIDKLQLQGPYGFTSPRNSRFLRWLLEDKRTGLAGMILNGEDFNASNEGQASKGSGAIILSSNGHAKYPVELAKAGKYRITIKAGAQQAGQEPAKFDVKLAGKTLGTFSVTAKNQIPQWFTVDADIPAGAHELQVGFLNDYYDEAKKEDRNFWLHQAKVEGPLGENDVPASAVPALVNRMGERLFRRPLTPEEHTKWQNFASYALKEGEPPLGALSYTLEAMLVSPSFLFRGTPQPVGEVVNGAVNIDEYSLANRLSYFLWAAPPDEPLLQLAAKGELRKNLTEQIKRMIADWRTVSLTQDFAGQWLQLRDMDIVSPDSRLFEAWTGANAYLMKTESQMFFEHILKENRPITEFLDSDYTFLNEKLAAYYGIEGVTGNNFQKVSLKGTPRGGILTQGSILTLTSTQTRTSPVKRGRYLLENILGTAPPPAPGDVPPLDETKVRSSKLTLREQFAAHRSAPACAGCHAFLDPMGFAFENYDAIGRWRDKDKENPIDASGQLIRGQSFKDLSELRKILARDMIDDFTRNLVENVLTYALGRGLEHSDKPAIKEIVRRAKENGYKFQDIIVAACESVPFQKMRAAGSKFED